MAFEQDRLIRAVGECLKLRKLSFLMRPNRYLMCFSFRIAGISKSSSTYRRTCSNREEDFFFCLLRTPAPHRRRRSSASHVIYKCDGVLHGHCSGGNLLLFCAGTGSEKFLRFLEAVPGMDWFRDMVLILMRILIRSARFPAGSHSGEILVDHSVQIVLLARRCWTNFIFRSQSIPLSNFLPGR